MHYLFHVLFLRTFLKLKKHSLRAMRSPPAISPTGVSARNRHAGRQVLLQQERLFKGKTLQTPYRISSSHCQILLPFYIKASFLFCLVSFSPSKSGIRMEAGNIPWELRTMAENTQKMLRKPIRLPSTCDLLRRMSAQAKGLDGNIVNKHRMLSTHRKRF